MSDSLPEKRIIISDSRPEKRIIISDSKPEKRKCVDCGIMQNTNFSGNPNYFRCRLCFNPDLARPKKRYHDTDDIDISNDEKQDIDDVYISQTRKRRTSQDTYERVNSTSNKKDITSCCDECKFEGELMYKNERLLCHTCFNKKIITCLSCNSHQEVKSESEDNICDKCKETRKIIVDNCGDPTNFLVIAPRRSSSKRKLLLEITRQLNIVNGIETDKKLNLTSSTKYVVIDVPDKLKKINFDVYKWILQPFITETNEYVDDKNVKYNIVHNCIIKSWTIL